MFDFCRSPKKMAAEKTYKELAQKFENKIRLQISKFIKTQL